LPDFSFFCKKKAIMEDIFLGIGSNMGKREKNILSSLQEIQGIALIKRVSHIFQSKPWGKKDQPDFLNMVICVHTDVTPENFLKALQKIEKKIGRKQREKWGMREIDLDILFWGDRMLSTDILNIPHPYWKERSFVLVPMAEMAPNFIPPSCSAPIRSFVKERGSDLCIFPCDEHEAFIS
jgi:2-amino-4-hydroxy-6-hydroxymethyldihydropteridine diphosphokinase